MKKLLVLAVLSLSATPSFAAARVNVPAAAPGTLLGSVSLALGRLPLLGPLGPVLGNVTAGLSNLPILKALPPVTGTLELAIDGRGLAVNIDTTSLTPVAVRTVNLPPLPGLPN